jgi:hypothetical protein
LSDSFFLQNGPAFVPPQPGATKTPPRAVS